MGLGALCLSVLILWGGEVSATEASSTSLASPIPLQRENRSLSFGHNLTATSQVLNKGQLALGNPVVAYGLTDKLSVGSSTWLLLDYNMYSLYLRYQTRKRDDYSRALQVAHFKTMENSRTYDMEATWINWVHGWHFEGRYNFYLNFQFHYYFNENRPFSLRRPRIWRDPTEWTVSNLHEVALVNGFWLMGEVAVLGLARKYPLIHTGASLQWRARRWLLQMGFSMTGTTYSYSHPQTRQDYATFGISNGSRHGLGDAWSNVIKDDFSIHPEIVFSFFL